MTITMSPSSSACLSWGVSWESCCWAEGVHFEGVQKDCPLKECEHHAMFCIVYEVQHNFYSVLSRTFLSRGRSGYLTKIPAGPSLLRYESLFVCRYTNLLCKTQPSMRMITETKVNTNTNTQSKIKIRKDIYPSTYVKYQIQVQICEYILQPSLCYVVFPSSLT